MKKLSILLSVITLIIYCTSCNKEPHPCIPQNTPCPDGPHGVGVSANLNGKNGDVFNYLVTVYYTNPGGNNTGTLHFFVGDTQYPTAGPLVHADIDNLGTAPSFIVKVPTDSFTLKIFGYNSPQRCGCDPTMASFHLQFPSQKISSRGIPLQTIWIKLSDVAIITERTTRK